MNFLSKSQQSNDIKKNNNKKKMTKIGHLKLKLLLTELLIKIFKETYKYVEVKKLPFVMRGVK